MKRKVPAKHSIMLSTGAACTVVSLYQLLVLGLARFYAMFSIGTTLVFTVVYSLVSQRRVFDGWGIRRVMLFFLLLLGSSVLIDRTGMQIGYWEYPHYDADDTVRKYLLEWMIALFYHFIALALGIELFTRRGMDHRLSFVMSLLVVVTAVGFVTELIEPPRIRWKLPDRDTG